MKSNRSLAVFLLCCACIFFLSLPAYGYIDPNAAGLVSQILTPLLVIAGAAVTFFRKQVGALFSGLSRRLRRRADA
jgi:hypothetical protein